jgi:hypothetical protein
MEWVESKYRLPKKAGIYLVYAESADPDAPLIITASWCEERGWGLPVPWRFVISHWMPLPAPPEK